MFSDQDAESLSELITSMDDIYCITGLEPEVISVLFAYISRSPKTLKENILDFLREEKKSKRKIRKFHEKWVLKFGHSSVAEHSDIKIGIEKCSIVASKVIEDSRLGSYTEKSTRYQEFNRDSIYTDDVIRRSPVSEVYAKVCDELFDLYEEAVEKLTEYFGNKHPTESKSFVQGKICDVARMILPAGTMTSIGVSYNARVAEQAISKMMSHHLPELRGIGKKIKTEVKKVCPTLIKYASESEYRILTPKALKKFVHERTSHIAKGKQPYCSDQVTVNVFTLQDSLDAIDSFCAAALYAKSEIDFNSVQNSVKVMSETEKNALIDACFEYRDYKRPPLRELEAIQVGTEFLIDFGAYRDIQRHRICTQIAQDLNMEYGYVIPEEIKVIGLEDVYHRTMERVYEAYHHIKSELPGYEVYVIPLAFRRRVMFYWNLREVFHFIELRSSSAGHSSYRRAAIDLYRSLENIFPQLMKFCRCTLD